MDLLGIETVTLAANESTGRTVPRDQRKMLL